MKPAAWRTVAIIVALLGAGVAYWGVLGCFESAPNSDARLYGAVRFTLGLVIVGCSAFIWPVRTRR